jgi:hypothetical protein
MVHTLKHLLAALLLVFAFAFAGGSAVVCPAMEASAQVQVSQPAETAGHEAPGHHPAAPHQPQNLHACCAPPLVTPPLAVKAPDSGNTLKYARPAAQNARPALRSAIEKPPKAAA